MRYLENIATRFAPSPTGFLHMGHLASIVFSKKLAKKINDKMILRIEDIDFSRCKKKFVKNIINDLNWLNISYTRTLNQSKRLKKYNSALNYLKENDLIYPCWLTRKEANKILSAPNHQYETIRDSDLLLPQNQINERKKSGISPAWRFRLEKGLKKARKCKTNFSWFDLHKGEIDLDVEKFGDFIIARKDISTSYHLSVTIDDHDDEITHVTRGQDLFEYSHIHRLLQIILNLNQPKWIHHPLILDTNGKKLSKSNENLSIRSLRNEGLSSKQILLLAYDMMKKSGFK